MKEITIYEAMDKAGKTYAQIRYAIKINKIKWRKANGIYLIPESQVKKLKKD